MLTAAEAVAEKIRLDMNSDAIDFCASTNIKKIYQIAHYDVEIVGSYDGDHYAKMTPVYD